MLSRQQRGAIFHKVCQIFLFSVVDDHFEYSGQIGAEVAYLKRYWFVIERFLVF